MTKKILPLPLSLEVDGNGGQEGEQGGTTAFPSPIA